jgi:hypothetical protein
LKEKTEVGSIVEKCLKEKRYGKSETFYCGEGEKASFVRRFPGFAVRFSDKSTVQVKALG